MCNEWKDLVEFDKRPDRPIGIRSRCKICSHILRKSDMQAFKYTQYKQGAKSRGMEFRLTKEEFLTLWQTLCSYCGDPIDTIGIDRIDSEKCYSPDNIVSCCRTCNVMKLALPREIFVNHCQKIIKHQSLPN